MLCLHYHITTSRLYSLQSVCCPRIDVLFVLLSVSIRFVGSLAGVASFAGGDRQGGCYSNPARTLHSKPSWGYGGHTTQSH